MKTITTGQGQKLLVDDAVYEVIKNKHFTWVHHRSNAIHYAYGTDSDKREGTYLSALVKDVMGIPKNHFRDIRRNEFDFTASNFTDKKATDKVPKTRKPYINKDCPPSSDPLVKHIGLGHGKYAIVDAADYEHLNQFNWSADQEGYAFNGKLGRMHRYILGLTDPKQYVDHINGITYDNRRSNIRISTIAGNMRNRRKWNYETASSAYKGVSFNKESGKWVSTICANGKNHYLGRFEEELDAAKAYDKAAKELHGEFASLNFE